MKIQLLQSITTVILLVLISQSCNKNVVDLKPEANYEFRYISACGWCAGSSELSIVNKMATFQYHAVCENTPRSFKKELTNNEFEELKLAELYETIKTLEINECGVCYDGCDETLTFIENETEYSIRFTNDEKISQIKDQIEKIRTLFNELDKKSSTE